jgi:hypothetical protein
MAVGGQRLLVYLEEGGRRTVALRNSENKVLARVTEGGEAEISCAVAGLDCAGVLRLSARAAPLDDLAATHE